jgi:hypothetical protein
LFIFEKVCQVVIQYCLFEKRFARLGLAKKSIKMQSTPEVDCTFFNVCSRRLLRESTAVPTPCKELVMGNPHYVGVKDASIHGVGGIIVGDEKACVPTVFRLEWPQDIKDEVLKTNANKKGKLTNSDLECAWVAPFVFGDGGGVQLCPGGSHPTFQ